MKIGVYLGSFSPMHKGHEAVIKQAAALNDVLLLFPGLGAKGSMKGVNFPFLGLVDDPEVYLYSDSSVEDLTRTGPQAFKSRLPAVRNGEIEPEVIDALFANGIVNSVGVRRGGTQETEAELDFPVSYVDFETPDVSSTKLRKMIFDLRNATSDDERSEKIMQIADLLPDTFPMERKLKFIEKLSGLDIERGDVFITGKEDPDFVFEIKRAEKGTSEYSTYLDEVIDELHHLKSSYGSRTKAGSRYRKEAHQIQNAISAIRHMKRSNDKIIHSNNQALNERVVRKIAKERGSLEEESLNRDVIKDFFRKFKK